MYGELPKVFVTLLQAEKVGVALVTVTVIDLFPVRLAESVATTLEE